MRDLPQALPVRADRVDLVAVPVSAWNAMSPFRPGNVARAGAGTSNAIARVPKMTSAASFLLMSPSSSEQGRRVPIGRDDSGVPPISDRRPAPLARCRVTRTGGAQG
jgi:hypothetical protein